MGKIKLQHKFKNIKEFVNDKGEACGAVLMNMETNEIRIAKAMRKNN